ncbi:MAG: hypothetical protein QM733_18920 [Ilumatobacteraceae bacterium]
MNGGRLPLAPLLRQLGFVDGDGSIGRFADRLGTNRTRLYRYVASGVPAAVADEWAVMLGFHPANIWGSEWWTVAL